MNISYLRELLEHVDKQKMCDDLGMSIKYLQLGLDMKEVIDSARLKEIMDYLELDIEQRIKLCTFNNYDLFAFSIN